MAPTKKIYATIGTLGVLIIILTVFVIYPLLNNLQKSSEDLISRKSELISKRKEIKTFTETEFLYQNAKENINKIDKIFVDPGNPIDLLNFLEQTSQVCNLKIEVLSLTVNKMPANPTEKSGSWPSISLQISSSGPFFNLSKFLENLESNQYLIEIMNINIKRLTEDELKGEKLKMFSLGDVNAEFSIKVYSK
jgi:hypothetical protein